MSNDYTHQRPVFSRPMVEEFIREYVDSPIRGYRVGYHYQYNKDRLHVVNTLDEINWHHVRRITILFADKQRFTFLIDGDACVRDGIRLKPKRKTLE